MTSLLSIFLEKINYEEAFELGIPEMMDAVKIFGPKIFTIVDTVESKMAIALIME